MSTLIINIQELLQIREASIEKVSGAEMAHLPSIKNAYLLIKNEVIHDFGSMENCPVIADANIIDATGNRMGITEDKVMMNIAKYGNTTAGTIPLLLWDYEKKLKKGDNLILAAFGGGFTWGATYLKWAY